MVRIVTGFALHRLEHAVEVLALQRQQLVAAPRGDRFSLSARIMRCTIGMRPFAEEHVLGAAEADAARAERVGELRLIRLIGVGAHAEAAELVGPRQQLVEALIDRRLLRLHLAGHDLQDLARLRRHLRELHLAGEPVERDEVAFLDRLALDR